MLLRGHQGEGIGGAAAVKEPVPQLLESMCSTNMRVLTNTGEGAGGEGAFKEAEGTGMGEGHGAKDVSDQIEDQDQLLGAQQTDAPPEEPQEQQVGITVKASLSRPWERGVRRDRGPGPAARGAAEGRAAGRASGADKGQQGRSLACHSTTNKRPGAESTIAARTAQHDNAISQLNAPQQTPVYAGLGEAAQVRWTRH